MSEILQFPEGGRNTIDHELEAQDNMAEAIVMLDFVTKSAHNDPTKTNNERARTHAEHVRRVNTANYIKEMAANYKTVKTIM